MTTTSDTTNAIIKYLLLRGHFAWRNQTIGKVRGRVYTNKRGVADILCVMSDGTHLEVEVKTGRDRASKYQLEHADEVRRRHGLYIFAKTFDDFEKQWKQIITRSEPSTANAQG